MRNIDSNTLPRRFDRCRFLFHRTFATTFAAISALSVDIGWQHGFPQLGVKRTCREVREIAMTPTAVIVGSGRKVHSRWIAEDHLTRGQSCRPA